MRAKQISDTVMQERMFAIEVANQFGLVLSETPDTMIYDEMTGQAIMMNNKYLSLYVENPRTFLPFNPLRDSRLMSLLLAGAFAQLNSDSYYIMNYALEHTSNDLRICWIVINENGQIKKISTEPYINDSVAYLDAIMTVRGEKTQYTDLRQYDVELKP